MAFKWDDFFDIMQDVGPILSDYARGSAQGRQAEAGETLTQDQQAINRYLAQLEAAGIDLNQRKFALGAPSERAGQAVRGDIMANAQDATISGLPSYIRKGTVSGGLRPSLMSPQSRQFGKELTRNALLQQMQGDKFAPLPTAPNASALPQPGAGEQIAGGVGTAGSILGAAGKAKDLFDIATQAALPGAVEGVGGGAGGGLMSSIAPYIPVIGAAIGALTANDPKLGSVGNFVLPGLGNVLDATGLFDYEKSLPDFAEATSYGAKVKGAPLQGPGSVDVGGATSFVLDKDGNKIPTYGNVNLQDEDEALEAGFGEGAY